HANLATILPETCSSSHDAELSSALPSASTSRLQASSPPPETSEPSPVATSSSPSSVEPTPDSRNTKPIPKKMISKNGIIGFLFNLLPPHHMDLISITIVSQIVTKSKQF